MKDETIPMSEPIVEIVTLVVRVGTHALTVSPAEAVALRDALLKQFPLTVKAWSPYFRSCPKCGMTHDIDYGCMAKTEPSTKVGQAEAGDNHQL